MSWRLNKKQAGGGALFDLGSHILDLVRYLLGEYRAVFATTCTFIKERPLPDESASLLGPKFSIGWIRYHIASQFDFITRIVEKREARPSFLDGYKVQEVMETAQVSAREKRWVSLDELI